jgi:hypothetical protein
LIELAVVLVPSAGEVIATDGTLPRLTVTDFVSVPNALEHTTVIVLAPSESETLLLVVLVDAALFTVQVVPLGIELPPLTVYTVLIELAVVFVPLTGAMIETSGGPPRLTVIGPAEPLPKAFVQLTVIVFAPTASATELVVVLVDAAPFTVQVVPPGIELQPLTV